MLNAHRSHVAPFHSTRKRQARLPSRTPVGAILVNMGVLSPADLTKALAMQAREETRLGHILLSHNMVSASDLYGALSLQFGTDLVDLHETPPDPRLNTHLTAEFCIAENLIVWRDIGGAYVIVTSNPHRFETLRKRLPVPLKTSIMAIAPEHDVQNAIIHAYRNELIAKAESKTPLTESCRSWKPEKMARLTLSAVIVLLAFLIVAPTQSITFLTVCAIFTLILGTGLKLATALNQFRFQSKSPPATINAPETAIARLPVVSIMVPLFKEKEIASHLISRLKKLNYPKELLDICLVTEADDTVTHDTLDRTTLPHWVRRIKVPKGNVRTKPRAMNFALDFCRGSIIGVYDAEDAPHPDQIHKVVQRFHNRGQNVACLQGVLDFYNAKTNWLSRCFTIEYATWFRVFLPGLARMGFVVPLGGTTLFFRRAVLEKLGGWDAHNVTEDADLGIRLARHGYRTEIIETTTEEEANCRMLPWVKQRSRWLKGFAITWAVHMRNPLKLFTDLGFKKFIGMQILLIGTFSNFLLAPFLWSFWLIPLDIPHPLRHIIGPQTFLALGALFLLSELITISVGAFAVSREKHRFLTLWVPTMHFYFPLGALASYKAFYELMTRPFYWDKTTHGVFIERQDAVMTERGQDD